MPGTSCSEHSHSHSHSNLTFQSNRIINIFMHLCREFSAEQIHKSEKYFI
jgi:hypothetical protein